MKGLAQKTAIITAQTVHSDQVFDIIIGILVPLGVHRVHVGRRLNLIKKEIDNCDQAYKN